VPTLELVVTLGEVAPAGMRRWAELGRAPDRAALARAEADLDADDPINIQFTSGTTGHPKGATLTHRNILNNGYFTGRTLRLTPQDRI
ncbi:AMP-binding protein, partial [Streptomyces caniscabiei]|uniref:AMP-binding protein n=1 Tax=Streptomyces caniscabiei TaxID=2746961 RepID=UPI0038F6B56A